MNRLVQAKAIVEGAKRQVERDSFKTRGELAAKLEEAVEFLRAELTDRELQGPGFREVFHANLVRCVSSDGFNHPLDSWSIAEWTNAIAGEAGEACNLAKKLLRFRDNVRGNTKPGDLSPDDLKRRIALELADVVIYADLTCRALGFNLEEVTVEAFNQKSEELGLPYLAEVT